MYYKKLKLRSCKMKMRKFSLDWFIIVANTSGILFLGVKLAEKYVIYV